MTGHVARMGVKGISMRLYWRNQKERDHCEVIYLSWWII
jgi:hypothetical protein